MFRSGSTLTEQVLAGHSRVTAGGEIDSCRRLSAPSSRRSRHGLRSSPRREFDELASRYTASLSKLHPGRGDVTDKRPDNFLHIGLIKSLFPDAKIVHTTRNALDNCLSIYFLHLDHSMGYALDLMDIAHYYRQYRRLMAHWKSQLRRRHPRLRLRRLRARSRGRPCRSCSPSAVSNGSRTASTFQHVRNAVKTASVWQVREPLYRRSSGRWRNYARHLARSQAYLDDLIEGAEKKL